MDITLNGKTIPVTPLTYGVVKANGDVVDQVAKTGLSSMERTEASIAFLRLAVPDLAPEEIDNSAPGALMAAAMTVYMATFSRPEAVAPA